MSLTLIGEGGSSEKEGGEDDYGKEGMRKRRRQEREAKEGEEIGGKCGEGLPRLTDWLRYDI